MSILLHVVYVCPKNRHVFALPLDVFRKLCPRVVVREHNTMCWDLVGDKRWSSIFVVVFGHLAKQCGDDLRKLKMSNARFRGAVLVEHGTSHLKHYLVTEKRNDLLDLVLVCNRLQTAIHQHLWPALRTAETGLGYSHIITQPLLTREQACARFDLDPAMPIVLIAPTWIPGKSRESYLANLIPQIRDIPNHIYSGHSSDSGCAPPPGVNAAVHDRTLRFSATAYLLPHAAMVISDTSSVMFEFLYFRRPIIQLLWTQYANNPSTDWQLPAGLPTHAPVQLGVVFRLGVDSNLASVVQDTLAQPDTALRHGEQFRDCSGIRHNAHIRIAKAIQEFVAEGACKK